MLWFSFVLGLHFTFSFFKLIILKLPYPKTNEKEISAKDNFKELNHNIYREA